MINTLKILKTISQLSKRSDSMYIREERILSSLPGVDDVALNHLERSKYITMMFLAPEPNNPLPKAYALTPQGVDCLEKAKHEQKRDRVSFLSLLFAIIAALPVIAAFVQWLLRLLCP